jgi:nicotinamide-nucleotide amidase
MATGVELVQDDESLAHIRNLFAQRRRAMPDQNVRQAQFPRGSRPVPNAQGTAPGIALEVRRPCCPPCRVFALPGVPAEMVALWEESVGPAIAAARPSRRVICHRRLKVFGAGESDIEAMLPDMIRRKREPLVGITVSGATITLRITASGPNESACRRAMEPTLAQIREILGVLVFGEEDDELQHAVVRLLDERRQTAAVAEWATDGLVSHWLAEASAAGNSFVGGIVARNVASLKGLLNIDPAPDSLASPQTASALARAVRDQLGADYGLGVAAFPPEDLRSTGTWHVAVASEGDMIVKGFPLAGHPAIKTTRSAKQALNLLRLALLRKS